MLPVLNRELRVAAREKITYRMRFIAAFVMISFCAFSLWIVTLFGEEPIPGRVLYHFLGWMEFIFVMLAGFALTADSISEEKRENTLGLLFLTDLRGRDVVLGKLAAAGMRGLYAVVATFPVLSLPVLLGGTTLGEFGRMVLAALAALFLSGSIGIAASTMVRRGWAALGLAAAAVVFLAALLPAFSALARYEYKRPELARLLELFSPSHAFNMSFAGGWGLRGNGYWISLGITLGLALLALAFSSFVTPWVWKDRPPKRRWARLLAFGRSLKYGSRAFRRRFRRRLLDLNPVLWLSGREIAPSAGFMLALGLLAGLAMWFASNPWFTRNPNTAMVFPFVVWAFCTGIMHAALILRVAITAAERFGEDRRSGALELMLSTPMRVRDLLRGHWMALARRLAGPALLVLVVHQFVIYAFFTTQSWFGDEPASVLGGLRDVALHLVLPWSQSPIRGGGEQYLMLLVMLALIPLCMVNWAALGCLSTWLSLRVRKPLLAPLGALLLLHITPWLFFFGVIAGFEYLDHHSNLFRNVFRSPFSESLLLFFLAAGFIIANQLFWIWFSRRQLRWHFRAAATDRYQTARPRRWWQFRLA